MRVGRQRWLLQFPPEQRNLQIALAVVLMLMGYVVGAVPTHMVLEQSGVLSPNVEMALQTIYAPLLWLENHVTWFKALLVAERHFFNWMSGR